jgi:hypothetical protein
MGIDPRLVDALRRFRRGLFGAAAAMYGGEEWPWTMLRGSAQELEAMRLLRGRLDRTPEPADA